MMWLGLAGCLTVGPAIDYTLIVCMLYILHCMAVKALLSSVTVLNVCVCACECVRACVQCVLCDTAKAFLSTLYLVPGRTYTSYLYRICNTTHAYAMRETLLYISVFPLGIAVMHTMETGSECGILGILSGDQR